MTVDDKKVMKAMGSKRITFADLERVEKLTGCKRGGILPCGS